MTCFYYNAKKKRAGVLMHINHPSLEYFLLLRFYLIYETRVMELFIFGTGLEMFFTYAWRRRHERRRHERRMGPAALTAQGACAYIAGEPALDKGSC